MHLRRLASKEVVAGFHRLNRPREVLDVDGGCLLMVPLLASAWDALRKSWGPGARLLPTGRALDLTLQVVGPSVVLTVRGGSRGGDAAAIMRKVPEIAAIWAVGSRGSTLLHGAETVTEVLPDDDELSLGPTAFLQANKPGAELLWNMLAGEIGDVRGLRIVDAYAGAGAFGRRWAKAGARVLAIELNGDAVRAAAIHAPPGFEIVQARVEDRLGEALPADVVVLNPPRAGIAREAVEALVQEPPPRLLYVSCDPATLARDLGRLSDTHRPVRLQALDLFPQTGHVEVIATLSAK
jgi:23S rRNA (uracil1939-C5)-methyltransferase